MARRVHCWLLMNVRNVLRVATSAVIAAAALALASCAAATTVHIQGAPGDLAALAGDWRGTYSSPGVGREGTIWFRLVDGEDHAHGDVRMTPRGRDEAFTHFLSIRFVHVSENQIEGVLDNYWDPDCGCVAATTFAGRHQGSRLQGTFETRLTTGAIVTGRWRADRIPVR